MMLFPYVVVILLTLLASLVGGHGLTSRRQCPVPRFKPSGPATDEIALDVRAHWMHITTQALRNAASPCPFIPFASAIVNHTGVGGRGDLICTGTNNHATKESIIMHGEIAAILNCTEVLQDPNGRFKLTSLEARAAFADLTLYTNAESCPMCASAIRWVGLKEYVYGTSIKKLIGFGWRQIEIPSAEVFNRSLGLASPLPRTIASVDPAATDPLFQWQFNISAPCPLGCSRSEDGETCRSNIQN